MAEIEVINFADTPSIVNRYMLELRDINIQKDPLRFRTNLDRIGEIMAYEISKRLNYKNTEVQTPLGMSVCREPSDNIVLATILRAGLPFHHGFLNYFDRAENAFVSAYRKYKENLRTIKWSFLPGNGRRYISHSGVRRSLKRYVCGRVLPWRGERDRQVPSSCLSPASGRQEAGSFPRLTERRDIR